MEFLWIDVGIVAILLISTVIAIFRGFVKEAISLISLVLAFWLAMTFFNQVALLLPSSIDDATLSFGTNEFQASKLRAGIAFVSIVIGVLVAGALLNHMLGKITRMPVLRGIDRMLGALFGLARGAAVVVLIILATALTSFPSSEIWESSDLLPLFESGAQKVIDFMPPEHSKYFSFDGAEVRASSYSL